MLLKKKAAPVGNSLDNNFGTDLFLGQKGLYIVLVNDRFLESVSSRLRAANSLDHFCPVFASAAARASFVLIAVFAAFAMIIYFLCEQLLFLK